MNAQPTPDGPHGPHGGKLNDELNGGRTPSNRSVAVVIAARDEASRIALTVITARRLPGVDLVVVVDAGSTDSTARVAEDSGAEVIRLGARADRTQALLRGVARVTALEALELEALELKAPGLEAPGREAPGREAPGREAPGRETPEAAGTGVAGSGRSGSRHLLFLEPDVQSGAAEAVRLLEPVQSGEADAVLARDGRTALEAGASARRARRGIERATGFSAGSPIAAEVCLTRKAFAAAEPLSGGAGAMPGLIIDLMRHGFRVVEVPVAWSHRPRRGGLRAGLREFGQWREVGRTLSSHR
jgi:glycosyltransferase involved in cell wall biosynthesis